MLLPLHLNLVPVPNGGGSSKAKRRKWKNTREILADLKEEREEELVEIALDEEPPFDEWTPKILNAKKLQEEANIRIKTIKSRRKKLAIKLLLMTDE